jgi:hypothetical protein
MYFVWVPEINSMLMCSVIHGVVCVRIYLILLTEKSENLHFVIVVTNTIFTGAIIFTHLNIKSFLKQFCLVN